jgi:transcriptional regulator with XRE-family HTH domain
MNPLRAFRKANGLTAIQVANRLGVSERSVLAWEKAAFKPSKSASLRLARLMGKSPSELSLEWLNWLKELKNETIDSDLGSAA